MRSRKAQRTRVRGRDVLLAVVVAVLLLIGRSVSLADDFVISMPGRHRLWLPGPGDMAMVLAGSLPLAFRRVAPISVLAVTATAAVLYQAFGYRPPPLPLGVLVALYTVVTLRRPLIGSAAAGAYMFAITVGALTGWVPLTDDQYYTYLVSVVATGMLGYGVALGRARARLAEQRAEAMAQQQEVLLRTAVEQEQSRIAREVHDIVAHDMSVIVAQAAAARRVFERQPNKAAEALASIEVVSRDALDGLRRLVHLLRSEPEQDERSPQPGLARLPRLLEQVRRAGLPVELTVRGMPRPLPATVELNAYRIVQEALTNTLKHAGRSRATVTLDYRGHSLGVEVRDNGSKQTSDAVRLVSAGYGLISMQQRAAMLGGRLHAGPDASRGFRVSVELPLPEGAG